jgi:uncharacterized protein YciW
MRSRRLQRQRAATAALRCTARGRQRLSDTAKYAARRANHPTAKERHDAKPAASAAKGGPRLPCAARLGEKTTAKQTVPVRG